MTGDYRARPSGNARVDAAQQLWNLSRVAGTESNADNLCWEKEETVLHATLELFFITREIHSKHSARRQPPRTRS